MDISIAHNISVRYIKHIMVDMNYGPHVNEESRILECCLRIPWPRKVKIHADKLRALNIELAQTVSRKRNYFG